MINVDPEYPYVITVTHGFNATLKNITNAVNNRDEWYCEISAKRLLKIDYESNRVKATNTPFKGEYYFMFKNKEDMICFKLKYCE